MVVIAKRCEIGIATVAMEREKGGGSATIAGPTVPRTGETETTGTKGAAAIGAFPATIAPTPLDMVEIETLEKNASKTKSFRVVDVIREESYLDRDQPSRLLTKDEDFVEEKAN